MVLLLGVALLLTSCATTPKVQTQAKPGGDYSQFHTFALLPLQASGPAADPGLVLRVAEPVRQTVTETLTAKGFTLADRAQADFAVNIRGQSMPKVEVSDWGYQGVPAYGYWGRYRAYVYRPPEVRTVEERTLSVEIFDNRTKELAWVGWTKSESYGGQVKFEKLQEAIRAILAEFPPTPKPVAK
jgi:hypothetical protein